MVSVSQQDSQYC